MLQGGVAGNGRGRPRGAVIQPSAHPIVRGVKVVKGSCGEEVLLCVFPGGSTGWV